MKGLEPPRRKTPDPKSGAATNYATSANWSAKIILFLLCVGFVVKNIEKLFYSYLNDSIGSRLAAFIAG